MPKIKKIIQDDAGDYRLKFLRTGQVLKDPSADVFDYLTSFCFWKNQVEFWLEHREKVVGDWIRSFPGRRPFFWWRHDAPRRTPGSDLVYEKKICIPRARIDGPLFDDGPDPEVFPVFEYGIQQFVYPETALFESEAAYLRRHGLMTKAEAKRLHQADFEPVTIVG